MSTENFTLYMYLFYCAIVLITEIKVIQTQCKNASNMGESFQDYSQIQDFEADFP